MKYLILLLTACNCTTLVLAQTTADLETDRPDQTETPYSVGKWNFQAENGFSRTRMGKGIYSNDFVSLWRFGLGEKFELRTEILQNRVTDKNTYPAQKGFEPVAVGFKTNLLQEKGWLPKTSVIVHLALPGIASDGYRGNYYSPDFRFTMQHSLGKKQSLSYNLGGEWGIDDGKFTPLYTLATGYDFTGKLYGYIELFGFFPQHQVAEHSIDGGFAFLLKPNIQFDVSAGIGITSTAPKNYWALGLSFRLLQ